MPRSWFLGRESLGPDAVSPTVPADSPRHPQNRQSMEELEADRTLAKLTDKIVDDGRHVFRQPKTARLKAHHVVVGSAPVRATHELWKLPDGTIARHALSAHKTLAKKRGWVFLGSESKSPGLEKSGDIDERIDIGEGETSSMREHLEGQLRARDANAPRQRIGRQWIDGEGAVPLFDGDDSPVAVPHDKRTTMAKLSESVKPKDGEP